MFTFVIRWSEENITWAESFLEEIGKISTFQRFNEFCLANTTATKYFQFYTEEQFVGGDQLVDTSILALLK